MHFIGMQAFSLPIRRSYDLGITVFSLAAAIAVAALALYIASRKQMGMKAVAGGAAMMATGICIMHYSGMPAMKMQTGLTCQPVLVAPSALIASLRSASRY